MPDSTNISVPAELERKMDEAIGHYPREHRRSAAIPLLHLWQERFGFISDEAVLWIADKLGLQPINILELVTFYPMFRQESAGKTHIRVCRTLSCAMAGSFQLMENLCARLGIQQPSDGDGMHNPISVSADGNYSVEFVECLASCHTAPVCMIGERLHEKVDPNSAADLLKEGRSPDRPHEAGGLETAAPWWPPHLLEYRLIYKNIGRPGWTTDIDCYLRDGGYEQLKQALTLSRSEIVNKVKNSGLRGRGGAGFSCGLKWSFIKSDEKRPVYLICNADESEPGTFKDRYIIHEDPHQLLEGILISCYALNARTAYIYIRGEFPEGAKILERAIDEARAHNFLGKNILGSGFDAEIYIHRGAGAYICGEETGLIESLEGKRGYPRIKPPYFPAVLGLYMCPTIVNNVETLCHVKHIIAMGGADYAKLGRPNNTGTRIFCVSGDVQRPGYFEIEVGAVTMGRLIYEMAGGLSPGRKLKAVIPGGSSAKVLRADERFKIKEKQPDGSMVEREMSIDEIPMDFDSLTAAGSMAGSGGVIVLDDSRDMVWVLNNINEFYAHESCGQCTPCREGSLWMKKITDRMLRGGGVVEDPKTLKTVGDNIAGRTICAFGEACAWPTQSFVEKFPEEFAARARKPVPPPLPPEYTPEELIEEELIPTLPMAHDPGWEKAGAKGTI
ncbi:MAG: NADH-quinone oxidoreductase subunit NuoF [Verrucomicrobia bacterium]|nr:MAG: NADH-quinone oxidoreductase subunit NuoF [Verrucomicrobiota bacterium]